MTTCSLSAVPPPPLLCSVVHISPHHAPTGAITSVAFPSPSLSLQSAWQQSNLLCSTLPFGPSDGSNALDNAGPTARRWRRGTLHAPCLPLHRHSFTPLVFLLPALHPPRHHLTDGRTRRGHRAGRPSTIACPRKSATRTLRLKPATSSPPFSQKRKKTSEMRVE